MKRHKRISERGIALTHTSIKARLMAENKRKAEEVKAGSPARSPEAKSQMAASVPGQKEFGRAVTAATVPLPFVGAPEQIVLLSIRRAASAWTSFPVSRSHRSHW